MNSKKTSSARDFVNASEQLEPLEWLEADLYAAIGMVVTKHTYLEAMLQYTIYDLLEVDDALGRIAVRQPRTSDRLTMIGDLAKARGLSIDQKLYKTLKSDLTKVATLRDALAHGIFFKHPETGGTLIREISGNWQPEGMAAGIKKRIHPIATQVTPESIGTVAAVISGLIGLARTLRRSLREQLEERQ